MQGRTLQFLIGATIKRGLKKRFFSENFEMNRRVHTLICIMGNKGKFYTKKKSRKTYIYLDISVLISHLETKHVL